VSFGYGHRFLIFFHGAGGTASDGLSLLKDAASSRGLLVLLPSSALPTWDLIHGAVGPDLTALDARLAAVFETYQPGRVTMAGFSNGATYALALGLANGDLVDDVLAFSPGYSASAERVGRPRIWITHGIQDAGLPVERCGRRVAAELRAERYDVTYREFTGGHVLTPSLLTAALDGTADG
jgi:phospholipase/carboxylesterase